MTADAVLDVEHIAGYASRLGRHVTIVRIEGGMHDLTLSSAPVRARVFDELDRWMRATHDPILKGPIVAPKGATANDPDGISPRDQPHTL